MSTAFSTITDVEQEIRDLEGMFVDSPSGHTPAGVQTIYMKVKGYMDDGRSEEA